ncbi:hypothetical protein Taro_049141, partial [Colocasia esculenta]|nr:hypothetical protein [Colocasia esculenta]
MPQGRVCPWDLLVGTQQIASLCSLTKGRAVCAGVGRQPFWRLFPEGVPCVPVLAGLVLVTSQLCCFCGGCHANSLSPGVRHLRACPRDRLLPFPGTPSPARLCQRMLLRAAGVLKSRTWSRRGKWWGSGLRGGSALVQCEPASPSHCLALHYFWTHVGRSSVGPQFGRTVGVLCRHQIAVSVTRSLVPFMVAPVGSACGPSTLWRYEVDVLVVRRCFSHGCSVSLVVTPGCSFLTSWRSGMLGACVVRLWSHVVTLVFCELHCLVRCVPRVCFRIVLSGLTLVAGRGIALSSFASALLEFRLLWLLFEFIAYLTGLNSNPSGSSDLWVAAQPSASLTGVWEVRWLALQQGPSVSCRRALLLLLGVRASSVVAGLLVLRLGLSSACMSVW